MKTRVLSALLAVGLLLLVLFTNNPWVIRIAVCVVSLLALFEIYSVFGYLKYKLPAAAAVLSTAALIFINEQHFILIPLVLFLYLLVMCVMVVMNPEFHIKDASLMIFFYIYICLSLACISFTNELPQGGYLVWLIFMGACVTDTFAYFSGMLFGKHKLCPRVSPKKTVEGSIGGMAAAVIVILIYGAVLNYLQLTDVSLLSFGILALSASVIAQIGDLTASVIKRENHKKDFGNIMPGHGGVLDRFDSIILVAPLVYWFCRIFLLQ